MYGLTMDELREVAKKSVEDKKFRIYELYQQHLAHDKLFEKLVEGTLLTVKNYEDLDEYTLKNHKNLSPEAIKDYHLQYRLKEKGLKALGTSHVEAYGLNNFEGHPFLSDKDDKYEFDTNLVFPGEIIIFMKYITHQIPKYPHHFYLPGTKPRETTEVKNWAPRILCYKPDNHTYIQLPSTILNIL